MGIDRLSLEARVLYSAFCLFLLVGMASSAWLYVDDGLGLSSAAVQRYYLGAPEIGAESDAGSNAASNAGSNVAASSTSGGPALALPDEEPAGGLRLEKPARQVMETFHFHLFSVPVCLLIVGHLFMMCALSTRVKVWLLVLASLFTMLHLVGPLLVRFGSPSFAPLFVASAVGMTVLWSVLLVLPLVEMWRPPRREAPAPNSGGDPSP